MTVLPITNHTLTLKVIPSAQSSQFLWGLGQVMVGSLTPNLF